MVLQQQEEVAFWGGSSLNEKIKINGSWGASSTTTSNEHGKWSLKLKTPKAGGPFTVQIETELKTIAFKDVLIGEVWLSSGQSNMEWKMNQCEGCIDSQEEEIANANYNNIRMFNVPMDLTGEEIKNEKWLVTNSENANKFSAAAYFFARKLHAELKIPIGIVNTSWGGTRVEAWTSNKKLRTLNSTKNEVPKNIDYDLTQEKLRNFVDSIYQINDKKYGFQTFEVPKWSDKKEEREKLKNNWAELDIGDKEYKNMDFDDSSWDFWSPKMNDDPNSTDLNLTNDGRFESVFEQSNTLLSDGIIWFRTKVIIDDISEDYQIIIKNGIDDSDQTYFNGKLVGNTFPYNGERNYEVSKSILKKGENIISIRITDLMGTGGFNSPLIIQNTTSNKEIPFNKFKFKHHAFIINANSIIVHDFSLKELLKMSDQVKYDLTQSQGILINSPNGYSTLFEKMLSPVIPYGIKGVIWYQGESNVDNYNEYQELFAGMIEDWRENWGYDFPFYFAQIAPHKYEAGKVSQGLREAQRNSLIIEKTGMAILMDIGEEDDIHPRNKQDVGKRLALLALDNDYDFDIVSSGPLYKSHKSFKKYIEVDFDRKGSGLVAKGEIEGFEIAGDDGIFYNAKAKIIDNKVKVSSSKVVNPKNIRYGWENWTIGTLFNNEGLPASSFSSINSNKNQ